ncbi:MAG: MotA/TolQ/ExbB proton channel family protein [Opitutales bacterium]
MNNRYLTFFLFASMVLGTMLLSPELFSQAQGPAAPAVQAGEGEATAKEAATLLDLLAKGGALMIPIGLCSVLAVYVIIWQFFALRRDRILPSDFLENLRSSLGSTRSDKESAFAYCDKVGGPVSRIFKAGIPKIGKGEQAIEKAIEDAGSREVGKMKRQLRPISAVATISPLLGLLGTVYGMIGAFQSASAAGAGKADTLAKGIYEALVTTAAGLTLAIPVLIFYQILSGKVDSLVDDIDEIAIDFIEHAGDKSSVATKRKTTSKTAAKTKKVAAESVPATA